MRGEVGLGGDARESQRTGEHAGEGLSPVDHAMAFLPGCALPAGAGPARKRRSCPSPGTCGMHGSSGEAPPPSTLEPSCSAGVSSPCSLCSADCSRCPRAARSSRPRRTRAGWSCPPSRRSRCPCAATGASPGTGSSTRRGSPCRRRRWPRCRRTGTISRPTASPTGRTAGAATCCRWIARKENRSPSRRWASAPPRACSSTARWSRSTARRGRMPRTTRRPSTTACRSRASSPARCA